MTNYLQLSCFRNSKYLLPVTVSLGQESRRDLVDSFVPRSLVRLQIRCQVALQTYESLGCFQAYGRSASMAHSHGWKVGAGCGLGGCNFFPHGPLLWAAGGSLQHGTDFPQSSQYRREEGRHLSVLIAWTQKSCTVTSSGILGHGGQAWFHMGGDGTWL